MISIHALREEGDLDSDIAQIIYKISIHALREEGDQRQPCIVAKLLYFYPRPPRGGRLQLVRGFNSQHKFLSTPSARRATGDVVSAQHIVDISIHALREEGDVGHGIVVHRSGISIHALREEGDAGAGKC